MVAQSVGSYHKESFRYSNIFPLPGELKTINLLPKIEEVDTQGRRLEKQRRGAEVCRLASGLSDTAINGGVIYEFSFYAACPLG